LESSTVTKHLSSSKARRLTLQGLLAASVVGLGIAGVFTQFDRGSATASAQVETQPQDKGLDLVAYRRVVQARQSMGLENKDLAALGLSDAEASAVLTQLVQWCETNKAAITQARQAINTAKRELRDQQRLVRTGQATSRQLTDADGKARSVEEAEAGYANLLNNGAASVMQAVPGKTTAWQNAAGLKGQLDSELRYLTGMNASRLQTLSFPPNDGRGDQLDYAAWCLAS